MKLCRNCKHHIETDDCRVWRAFNLCYEDKSKFTPVGVPIPDICIEKNKDNNCNKYVKSWYRFWVKE